MYSFYDEDIFLSNLINVVKVRDEISRTIHTNRPYHGIVLFKKGQSHFVFESERELLVNENEIIYLPKHSNYTSLDESNTECIAVNFDILGDDIIRKPFILNERFGEKYTLKFEHIMSLWIEKKVGYLSQCLSALYDIIAQIQRDCHAVYLPSKQHKLVDDILLYIHTRLSDASISVAGIAKEFGMSPEYLRKIFRICKGLSPLDYILNKRIELAKVLIETKEIKLSAISDECGFNDYAYFSRAFKKKVGLSPLNYQKQCFEGTQDESYVNSYNTNA